MLFNKGVCPPSALYGTDKTPGHAIPTNDVQCRERLWVHHPKPSLCMVMPPTRLCRARSICEQPRLRSSPILDGPQQATMRPPRGEFRFSQMALSTAIGLESARMSDGRKMYMKAYQSEKQSWRDHTFGDSSTAPAAVTDTFLSPACWYLSIAPSIYI